MKKIFLTFLLIAMMGPTVALAENHPAPRAIPCVPGLPCINETTQRSKTLLQTYVVDSFLVTFIQGFMGVVAIAAVIFLIVGGLQLHAAVGNEEALGKAKKTLTWAIVGLVIAMLSFYIVSIVSSLPLGK